MSRDNIRVIKLIKLNSKIINSYFSFKKLQFVNARIFLN